MTFQYFRVDLLDHQVHTMTRVDLVTNNLWRVVAPDPSSGVVSSRVRVLQILVPLSKALDHYCFEKVGKVVHSALPARLLVDDTHAYILKDC